LSESNEGIVLLAKLPGITSFSALWQVKDALKIKKTGHTGTLDTFADGLLVALTGKYTRLVPYITDCDKEYLAYVSFGTETDTLDPEGTVVAESPLPEFDAVIRALEGFKGEINQVPPLYSAVHVEGKRASDRVRGGEAIELEPRKVTIHECELLESESRDEAGKRLVAGCSLRVRCSKGTYIRSLARDIALAAGSRAHLAALRRTRIGPFPLDRAAGKSLLTPFSKELSYKFGVGERPPRIPPDELRTSLLAFTRDMASIIGLPHIDLAPDRRKEFSRGIHPEACWFSGHLTARNSVFCGEEFMGTIVNENGKLAYGFVCGGPA